MSTDTALRRTPLYDQHVAAGARLVDFAGWEMPVLFEGIIDEHRAVRTSAGVFDVSHMGQLAVRGASAHFDLQRLLSNDLSKLREDGQAQYTLLLNERGGVEDDLIAYRLGADEYLLVVNASNVAHDAQLVRDGLTAHTSVEDISESYAMLALQGPRALDVLAEHLADLRELPGFRFTRVQFEGGYVLAATTGYTGERGCELLVPPSLAPALWEMLASDDRVTMCGLGSRDTLRLEACYPLHGADIDADTSAVSAGLSWVCGWTADFVGREALRKEQERGSERLLVALAMTDPGIPRAGCTLVLDGEAVGEVTSGTMSPCLERGVALGYLRSDLAETGQELSVDVRGRLRSARVCEKPLYRSQH